MEQQRRERDGARPQLRPVGQELLLLERLLAQQGIAVTRREQQQLAPRQRDDVLDQVVRDVPGMVQLSLQKSSGKRDFTGE